MKIPEISLVIPVWNESSNLDNLIESIVESQVLEIGVKEVVLVENGSQDSSLQILLSLEESFEWVKVLKLDKNYGYGGGLLRGINFASHDFVAYIPADLQIHPSELRKAIDILRILDGDKNNYLIKGIRTTRDDNSTSVAVSKVYSQFAKAILGLDTDDVNGLPKLFNRNLIDGYEELESNFVFDAQILYIAKKQDLKFLNFQSTSPHADLECRLGVPKELEHI